MKYLTLRIKQIFSLIFILYSLLHIFNIPVSAQEKIKPLLRISPILLNIALSPGKTYAYKVTVENLTDISLPLHAELDRLDSSDEENVLQFSSQESPFLSWISIDKKELIIEPQSTQSTVVTITIPKTVPIGGYYAIIFFQPLFPNIKNAPTEIQAKIGLPILANIGVGPSKEKKGEITTFSFGKFLYEKPDLTLHLRVKNTSLYHFSAKPFIQFHPIIGEVKTQPIEEKIILPGKSRSWNNSLEINHRSYGLYKVVAAVSTGEGQQINRSTYLLFFPLKKTILILFFVFLGVFIFKKRKRFKKALQSLVKNV